jgi:hypothetical protein
VNSGDGFVSVAYDSGRKQLVSGFTNRKDEGCVAKQSANGMRGYPNAVASSRVIWD